MSQLLLIRHCESSGQAPDAPLTEAGYEQAIELARLLAEEPIELILSSPFRRALFAERRRRSPPTRAHTLSRSNSMLGIGHSSWLPAQRPSLGVMFNPYGEPLTGKKIQYDRGHLSTRTAISLTVRTLFSGRLDDGNKLVGVSVGR